MKLLHLADLHIGKRVNGFSMLEDQNYILSQIVSIAEAERPQAVLIAGDVYDKPIPSAEAVQVLDRFLVRLSRLGIQVYIISGNHDSAERVAFGRALMEASGVHISPVYDGTVTPFSLTDEFGSVRIFLIPFLKPANVRAAFPEEEIETYTDAMRVVVEHLPLNPQERNVAVVHQFVTGAETCDSEERSVGGLDDVDATVFQPFDYVALGHLHGPQKVGRESIRYAGSPLKYSFSELNHRKSVTVVELGEKGTLAVRTVSLKPLRELRELRGSFASLTEQSFYEGQNSEDYYRILLTDEEDVPNAAARLRSYYPNWMVLDYDNRRTQAASGALEGAEDVDRRQPIDLFDELYQQQNGQPMSGEQRKVIMELIEEIWGEAE